MREPEGSHEFCRWVSEVNAVRFKRVTADVFLTLYDSRGYDSRGSLQMDF